MTTKEAVKRQPKPKFKGIMVRWDCYQHIRQLASSRGVTFSELIDELVACALEGKSLNMLPKTPHEEIIERLDGLEKKLESRLPDFAKGIYMERIDRSGNRVRVEPKPATDGDPGESLIDAVIREENEQG